MSGHASDVQEAMARPTADTVQITFRIPTQWLAQADLVAGQISSAGFTASRTDALRAAIARGLEVLELERHKGPSTAKQSPSPSRTTPRR
jgi:hypothetical protein